jgi:hypothetical protein
LDTLEPHNIDNTFVVELYGGNVCLRHKDIEMPIDLRYRTLFNLLSDNKIRNGSMKVGKINQVYIELNPLLRYDMSLEDAVYVLKKAYISNQIKSYENHIYQLNENLNEFEKLKADFISELILINDKILEMRG